MDVENVACREFLKLKPTLVNRYRHQVEVHRRGDDGRFSHEILKRNDVLRLAAMPGHPFECKVDEIYENVSLPFRVKEDEAEYVFSDETGCFELEHDGVRLS